MSLWKITKKRIERATRKSYSWFTWSKSVDQPLKIIDFLKGVLQCFSFPATLICLPQKISTLFVPAKPSISTTYRQVVLCCLLVSWASSRSRKAPVLILQLLWIPCRKVTTLHLSLVAQRFYSFSKFGFRLISYLYCHCFDRKHIIRTSLFLPI